LTGAQKYSSQNDPSMGLRTWFSSHTRMVGGIAFGRSVFYMFLSKMGFYFDDLIFSFVVVKKNEG
jgi:hypothetical protein